MPKLDTIEQELDDALDGLKAGKKRLLALEARWNELQQETMDKVKQLESTISEAESTSNQMRNDTEAWVSVVDGRIQASLSLMDETVSRARTETDESLRRAKEQHEQLRASTSREIRQATAEVERSAQTHAATLGSRWTEISERADQTLGAASTLVSELEGLKLAFAESMDSVADLHSGQDSLRSRVSLLTVIQILQVVALIAIAALALAARG